MPLFETASDLQQHREMIARRFHGVIEVRDGQLQGIRFRPWPTFISQLRVIRDGVGRGEASDEDVCRLYYDQIIRMPGYLVLKYVHSEPGTSFRTVRAAARILDAIAEIKRSDAIVCEVSNSGISDRLLNRWGWESHVPTSRRRHFIKRFYGSYPAIAPASELSSCELSDSEPQSAVELVG